MESVGFYDMARVRPEGGRAILLQMHFHVPSEHDVAGERFPLEAHFVHQDETGALLVVSELYREGDANQPLDAVIAALPGEEGDRRPVDLDVNAVGPQAGERYYRYEGSLTTPPCSEGVTWHVLQAPRSASPAQLAAIHRALTTSARPLQPLGGREVRASGLEWRRCRATGSRAPAVFISGTGPPGRAAPVRRRYTTRCSPPDRSPGRPGGRRLVPGRVAPAGSLFCGCRSLDSASPPGAGREREGLSYTARAFEHRSVDDARLGAHEDPPCRVASLALVPVTEGIMASEPPADDDRSSGYEAVAAQLVAARDRSRIGAETIRAWTRSLPRAASILDLGCGSGVPVSEALLHDGFVVYGVDASPSLTAAFRRRFPHAHIACEPVEDSRFFDRTFDGVVAVGLMFLLPAEAQERLIRQVAVALKAGGRFLFTSPAQSCTWPDMLTGRRSLSLGAEAYRALLSGAGLPVVGEHVDEGGNHYYDACRR